MTLTVDIVVTSNTQKRTLFIYRNKNSVALKMDKTGSPQTSEQAY